MVTGRRGGSYECVLIIFHAINVTSRALSQLQQSPAHSGVIRHAAEPKLCCYTTPSPNAQTRRKPLLGAAADLIHHIVFRPELPGLTFSVTSRGMGIFSTVSGWTTSEDRKPPEACHAAWHWNAQTPVRLIGFRPAVRNDPRSTGRGCGRVGPVVVDGGYSICLERWEQMLRSDRIQKAESGLPTFAVTSTSARRPTPRVTTVVLDGLTGTKSLAMAVSKCSTMEKRWTPPRQS